MRFCKIALTMGLFVLVLLLNFPANFAAAQMTAQPAISAVQTATGIQFYVIPASGEPVRLGSLPSDFRISVEVDDTNWSISNQELMAVSPNGNQIAFTATRGQESVLFIYDGETTSLNRFQLPESFQPVWSPDSTAILLSPCCDTSLPPPYNDFIYEIKQHQLIPLDTPQSDGYGFHWLPDSSGLVYILVNNLAFIARDGHDRRILNNSSLQAPGAMSAEICNFAWSKPQMRLYYTVGCVGGGEESREYLWSVGLEGDSRLEISTSFPQLYPEEQDISVVGIHPTDDGQVYIVLDEHDWRVFRLQAPGELDLVFEGDFSPALYYSTLSPDQKMIMLRSQENQYGSFEVVNLQTGAVVVSPDTSLYGVCDAVWIDDHTIAYSTIGKQEICGRVSHKKVLWRLTVETGMIEKIMDESEGYAWFLSTTPSGKSRHRW